MACKYTGKSFSEALILASTNPQYDKRFFIQSRVQNMKITSSEHVVYINCSECQNKNRLQKNAYVIFEWSLTHIMRTEFIELQVQYMKITSSEHVVYINCFLF